jgi:hypothetical protein
LIRTGILAAMVWVSSSCNWLGFMFLFSSF